MASARRDGVGGSAARLLGVLAVLLGLLAMHGLASTHHHAAAAGLVPPGAVHAGAHSAGVHSAGTEPAGRHSHTEHAPATNNPDRVGSVPDTSAGHGDGAAVGAAAVALPGPACDGHCQSGVAALCFAVLACAGVVALLAAGSHRRPGRRLPAPARTPVVQPLRHLSLTTPDPVKDLCVSRT